MTTTHSGLPRRWRQIAATATIFIAAVAVGTAAATTADAKPKKPGAGANQYWSCVVAQEDAQTGGHHIDISWEARGLIYENCCTDLGGIYNEQTLECYLPNGDTAKPQPTPPTPPPGATAVPPPGALNPAGLQ
jgi:hypothetical protein